MSNEIADVLEVCEAQRARVLERAVEGEEQVDGLKDLYDQLVVAAVESRDPKGWLPGRIDAGLSYVPTS